MCKKLEVVVLLLFVLLHCKSDTWIARHNLRYISYTLRSENNRILRRDLLAKVTSPFAQKIVVVGIHWHLNALKLIHNVFQREQGDEC